jgi:hypothetical protein
MAKKSKSNDVAQLLELLRTVLPKAVSDPKLAEQIYVACEEEIKAKNRVVSFENFCERIELPDLKPETVEVVQKQFEESFGEGKVAVVPHPGKKAATVEVILPDETFEGVVKVKPAGSAETAEEEAKPNMTAFPVALETDPELVWILGRYETLNPKEALMKLEKLQEDFWGSKAGQQFLRDHVDKTFFEFISRAPAKLFTETGLKRHYKEPEALKLLRPLKNK